MECPSSKSPFDSHVWWRGPAVVLGSAQQWIAQWPHGAHEEASHSEPCTIIFSPSDTALGGYAALVLLLRSMITVTRRPLSAFGSPRPVDHECHYQGECWHGDQHSKYDISHLCNLVGIDATVVPDDTASVAYATPFAYCLQRLPRSAIDWPHRLLVNRSAGDGDWT